MTRIELVTSSFLGARGRRCAAVPSGPSLTLASLRGRYAGRSIPLAVIRSTNLSQPA